MCKDRFSRVRGLSLISLAWAVASPSAATATDFYWRGDINGNWNQFNTSPINTNWQTTLSGGVDSGAVPGAADRAIFAATGAGNLATSLSSPVSLVSLQVDGTLAIPASIGGSNALTVGAIRHSGSSTFTIDCPLLTPGSTAYSFQVFDTNQLVISSSLTGARDLAITTLLTGGTVVLTGNDVRSGSASVSGIRTVLQLGSNTPSGSLNTNVNLIDGTLRFSRSDFYTYSRNISGSSGKVEISSGTVVLSGTNTYGGGTSLLGGALLLGSQTDIPVNDTLKFYGGSLYAPVSGLTMPNLHIADADGSRFLAALGSSPVTISGDILYEDNNAAAGNYFQITAPVFLPAGNHNVNNPSGGKATSAYELLISGPLSGPGTLSLNGSLAVAITTPGSLTGPVKVSSGLLLLGTTNALQSTGITLSGGQLLMQVALPDPGLTVGSYDQTLTYLEGTGGSVSLGSATLTVGDSIDRTFAGNITGSLGKLAKTGSGTLTLSGTNTNSGGVIVNGGTLRITSPQSLPNADVVLNTGTLDLAGNSVTIPTLHFADIAATRQIISSSGSPTVTLTGGISYDGNVPGGNIVSLSIPINLPAGSHSISNPNNGLASGDYDIVISKPISGAGTLNFSGSLFVAVSAPTTLTGPITLSAGRVYPAVTDAFASAAGLTMTGGVLDLSPPTSILGVTAGTYSQTLKYLDGTGGTIFLGNGTLTIGDNVNRSISASISGSGGKLVKTGTGTLTLNSVATYTGGTTLSKGTLKLGSGSLPPGGDLTFVSGSLDLNGQNLTANSIHMSANDYSSPRSIFSSSGSPLVQLTLSGDLTYDAGPATGSGFTFNTRVNLPAGNHTISTPDDGRATDLYDYTFNAPLLGEGNLVITGRYQYIAFNANNFNTGNVTLNPSFTEPGFPARLFLTKTNAFSADSGLIVHGGLVSLNPYFASGGVVPGNYNQTIKFLEGNGGSVDLGSATLTTGDSDDHAYAGTVSGTGTLNKTGSGRLTLTGTVTAKLHVSQGSVTLGDSSSLVAGATNGDRTLEPGTSLNFANSPGTTSHTLLTPGFALSILGNSNAYATVLVERSSAPNPARTSLASVMVLSSLTIANDGAPLGSRSYFGSLSLNFNDIIIHAGSTTLASLYDLARAGLTSSTGLITSPNPALYRLAIIQNSIPNSSLPYFPIFDGQGTLATDILVRSTYTGDTNLDGVLDGRDFKALMEGFTTGQTGWQNGDFNYDGVVDSTDFNLFKTARALYDANPISLGSPAESGVGSVTQIPEPAGLMLMPAGMMFARRRRKASN